MHFPSVSAIGQSGVLLPTIIPCESGPCEYAYVYMCENCMTIMLNIHFVLLTIGQMTHTSDSTTHYYSHDSHRNIISLHIKLQDTVTFSAWPTYNGCYFFPCYFFPSQNCYFLSVTFFPVTFFPSTTTTTYVPFSTAKQHSMAK